MTNRTVVKPPKSFTRLLPLLFAPIQHPQHRTGADAQFVGNFAQGFAFGVEGGYFIVAVFAVLFLVGQQVVGFVGGAGEVEF